jgi:protein-S-isoprenylcysteine O-methyltransferase Ste14
MENRATESLGRKALASIAKFVVALIALTFLPAGSLGYRQGWVFLLNFVAGAAGLTLYLLKYDPALLERRLNAGPAAEREASQKPIQLAASIVFCATFVVSALDHRFGWSNVPVSAVVAGNALVALSFLIILAVFKANSFASAIIEVGPGQQVVSTGPYAIVRHPMYAGALPMFLGGPLALGSWWALLTAVPMTAIIIVRLLDEERYLARNLPGYAAYCAMVRYRLVPGAW